MHAIRLFIISCLLSIIAVLGFSGVAFAWHPVGEITKTVQDNTTNSAVSSATDASSALTVSPGDTLTYTVTVSNAGAPAANHDDDMASTVMTDTLPAGVTLISNSSERQITENIGTIVPGQNVTKQYQVKVTDTTDGDVITNKACFTGNSLANDNAQSGCSTVVVKVHVPPTPTYACTQLSVTQGANRTVTVSSFQQTVSNGATFTNVAIDWNDNTTPLTSASPVNQTHQYSADGTYHIVATAHFTVNGADQMATSDACAATVTFTTPSTPSTPTTPVTPPAQLPNTGAGNVLIPVGIAAVLGYIGSLFVIKRRAAASRS